MMLSKQPIKYVYQTQEFKQQKPKISKKVIILIVIATFAVILIISAIFLRRSKEDKSTSEQPGPSAIPVQPFLRIMALDGQGRADELTVYGNDKKIIYKNVKTGKLKEVTATDKQLASIYQFSASESFQHLSPHYGVGCLGCLTYIFIIGDGGQFTKTVVSEWGIKQEPQVLSPFIKGFEDFLIQNEISTDN